MNDPLRSDRQPAAADVPDRDREARIEELLLAGLHHYFADQHELAINVWTRVLFIDRGHAKARAYIERARSAVAERQRHGDELLHTSSAALDRGDARGARELVTSAVEHGAASEDALALLARIERLESAARAGGVITLPPLPGTTAPDRAAADPPTRRWRWIFAGLLAGVIVGAGAIVFLVQQGADGWGILQPAAEVIPAELGAPIPIPTAAEVALSRAQTLHARGRLHEALDALAVIPAGDPLRARADEIRTEIQKRLLSAVRPSQSPARELPPRRP